MSGSVLCGLALLVAGAVAAVAAIDRPWDASAPYVVVAGAVIGSGLVCMCGGVAALRGASGAHQLYVCGFWIMGFAFGGWVVRGLQAFVVGLIPLTEFGPEVAFSALELTGAGMTLIGLGSGSSESREERDLVMDAMALVVGVLAVCGAIMLVLVRS